MKAAALAVLVSFSAVAEDELPPALSIDRPSQLSIVVEEDPSRSKVLDLPPGVFFPEPTMVVLSNEIQRLQKAEMDLQSQNKALGEMLAENVGRSGMSLKGAVIMLAIGLAVGAGTVSVIHALGTPR